MADPNLKIQIGRDTAPITIRPMWNLQFRRGKQEKKKRLPMTLRPRKPENVNQNTQQANLERRSQRWHGGLPGLICRLVA